MFEALACKHLEARIPDATTFPKYHQTTDFVDLNIVTKDIIEDILEKFAQQLSGNAMIRGTNSHDL
jgi:hypothetical protein